MPSLELIDWPALAANSLWVLGLALLLAWAGWKNAARQDERYNPEFVQGLLPAGGVLFCLGLGFTGVSILEKALWFILAGAISIFFIVQFRAKRRSASG